MISRAHTHILIMSLIESQTRMIFTDGGDQYAPIKDFFLESARSSDPRVAVKAFAAIHRILDNSRLLLSPRSPMPIPPKDRPKLEEIIRSLEDFLLLMSAEVFTAYGPDSSQYHALFSEFVSLLPQNFQGLVSLAVQIALKKDASQYARFFSALAALKGLKAADRDAILGVRGANETFFHYAVTRTELRGAEPQAPRPAASATLDQVLERAVAYLLQERVPSSIFRAELRDLVAARGNEALDVLARLAGAVETEAFAQEVLSAQLPAWRDPRIIRAMQRMTESLRNRGLGFSSQASDVVFVVHELPSLDLMLSILESLPALNILVVWTPAEGFDGLDAERVREVEARAKLLEDEVHDNLGMDVNGREKRLQVRVPKTLARAEDVLKTADRTLYDQGGTDRRTGSTDAIKGRVVYIYPESLPSQAQYEEAMGTAKTVRYSLDSGDRNLFGKAFLLLKSAAEISEGTLSTLLRTILDGEGKYTFQDERVTADMIAGLLVLDAEIQQHFAQAA
jgi:hypothetical protein